MKDYRHKVTMISRIVDLNGQEDIFELSKQSEYIDGIEFDELVNLFMLFMQSYGWDREIVLSHMNELYEEYYPSV